MPRICPSRRFKKALMSAEERTEPNPEASERLSIGEAIAETLKASARGIDLFLRSQLGGAFTYS